MLYFWVTFCSFIAAIILGIIIILWSNTTIVINYSEGEFRLKIKNIFFRYNSSKHDGESEDNGKGSNYRRRLSRFIKTVVSSDSENSEEGSDSDSDEAEDTDNSDDGNKLFERTVNSFKVFDKDQRDTLILIKDIVVYLVKYLRYKLYIKELTLNIDYGSGDAANTGILCGVFWTGYGAIIPVLSGYFDLNTPNVKFTPRFNRRITEIDFESIIKVKLGYIINAVIISAIKYFKKQLGLFA